MYNDKKHKGRIMSISNSDQEINLFIIKEILKLTHARMISAKNGHGHHIDIVRDKRDLESKETFLVAGYILESAEHILPLEEYLDIILPVPSGNSEDLENYKSYIISERDNLLLYDDVPSTLFWISKEYCSCLNAVQEVEAEVINELGIDLYLSALKDTSEHPFIASAKERALACVKAWKTHRR